MPNIKLLLTIALAVATQAHGQCPSVQLISSRPWERGAFGASVQIDGDVAVVADPLDQTYCLQCGSGAVHCFRRIDGAWRHEALLFHSRIGGPDGFGFAIALEGPNRLAASAPGEGVLEPGAGAIYIFEHNGEAWNEVAEILPVEPQWATIFGGSLLLRGDTLIVGQPKFEIAEGFVGAAWVYRLVNGRWEFAQKLMAPDPRPNAKFAHAVAMDAEWLAIGAPRDDELATLGGSVYLYRREAGGAFSLVEKLRAPAPEERADFGWDVEVRGDLLAVGAPGADGVTSSDGAVYLYEFDGGQWRRSAELRHLAPSENGDDLGASVAMHDGVLVAGAPRQWVPETSVGAAYLFRRRSDGSWQQAARLTPPGAVHLGSDVTTDGASVIVGAPGEVVAGGDGAAHIFDLGCLLCRVDLDGDGELTFFDFLAFQNLFAAGDLAADFDGDGALTFFDFGAFQTEFAAGCA